MPNTDLALMHLSRLSGLFDENGQMHFEWLLDPWGMMVNGLFAETQNRRYHLGGIARALVKGTDTIAPEEATGLAVEPLVDEDAFGLGLAWAQDQDQPFAVGLALVGRVIDQSKPQQWARLNGVAWLFEMSSGGDIASRTGDLDLLGTLVGVPDFLNRIEISATRRAGALSGCVLVVERDVTEEADGEKVQHLRSRELTIVGEAQSQHPKVDKIQLATFVVAAWVRQAAVGKTDRLDVSYRISNHLLPMLGDTGADNGGEAAYPIKPVGFLASGETGSGDFEPWENSLVGGLGAAVTFVWHLRALLTGVEDEKLWDGSWCLPLSEAANGASTHTATFHFGDNLEKPTEKADLSAGIWARVSDAGTATTLFEDGEERGDLRAKLATVQVGGGIFTAKALAQLVNKPSYEAVLGLIDTDLVGVQSPSIAQVLSWALDEDGHSELSKVTRILDEANSRNTWPALLGELGASLVGSRVRVPLHATVGPVTVSKLWLRLDETAINVDIDAALDLAGVRVESRGLGVDFDLVTSEVTPRMDGLVLSYDGGGIRVGGALASASDGGWQGGLTVSLFDAFSIAAVAGLDTMNGGLAMYAFGALHAPLGGPPWLFVTGIAAGFGYNYGLPDVETPLAHPFLKVLVAESPSFDSLGLEVSAGAFWLAAGVEFTSFGIIEGRFVAIVATDPFSIEVMGSAVCAFEPLFKLQLDLYARVDDEGLAMRAGLVDSYFVHPDLFGVQGDFALQVWTGGEHAGDFVFTAGGYGPDLRPPAHYPRELSVVGATASVWDWVNVEMGGYVAITPRAMTAGASLRVWADFDAVSAGFDIDPHIMLRWEPFKLEFGASVIVWFDFFGRHEISVWVDVWTPPFGGRAGIDLDIVSFEIDFGSDNDPETPEFAEVMAGRLKVDCDGEVCTTLSTAERTGLMGLEVLRGLASTGATNASKTTTQPGLDASAPIEIDAEFTLLVRTRLPVLRFSALPTHGMFTSTLTGSLDSPLSEQFSLTNSVGVSMQFPASMRGPVSRALPAALFGDGDPTGEKATVDGFDRFIYDAVASSGALAAVDVTGEYDLSIEGGRAHGEGLFPLPLAGASAVASGTLATPRVRTSAVLTSAPTVSVATVSAAVHSVNVGRGTRATPRPASSSAWVPVPASPVRRAELAEVSLQGQLSVRRRADGARDRSSASAVSLGAVSMASVAADGALNVAWGRAVHGTLNIAGTGLTRAIFLRDTGAVVEERRAWGSSALSVPSGTARAVILGEGAGAWLRMGMLAAPVGLDANGAALSLGGGRYAGSGCLVEVRRRWRTGAWEDPLQVVRGRALLGRVRAMRLTCPSGLVATLLVRLRPAVASPVSPLDQASLSLRGGTLGSLSAQQVGDEALLSTSVTGKGRDWRFDLEIGADWRVQGLIVVPQTTRIALLHALARLPEDLLDERIATADTTQTRVSWEVSA